MLGISVNQEVIVQTQMDTPILAVQTRVLQEVIVWLVLLCQLLVTREPSEERLAVEHRTTVVPAKQDTTALRMIQYLNYVIQVLSALQGLASLQTARLEHIVDHTKL